MTNKKPPETNQIRYQGVAIAPWFQDYKLGTEEPKSTPRKPYEKKQPIFTNTECPIFGPVARLSKTA